MSTTWWRAQLPFPAEEAAPLRILWMKMTKNLCGLRLRATTTAFVLMKRSDPRPWTHLRTVRTVRPWRVPRMAKWRTLCVAAAVFLGRVDCTRRCRLRLCAKDAEWIEICRASSKWWATVVRSVVDRCPGPVMADRNPLSAVKTSCPQMSAVAGCCVWGYHVLPTSLPSSSTSSSTTFKVYYSFTFPHTVWGLLPYTIFFTFLHTWGLLPYNHYFFYFPPHCLGSLAV